MLNGIGKWLDFIFLSLQFFCIRCCVKSAYESNNSKDVEMQENVTSPNQYVHRQLPPPPVVTQRTCLQNKLVEIVNNYFEQYNGEFLLV
jgi:hypothetical protein